MSLRDETPHKPESHRAGAKGATPKRTPLGRKPIHGLPKSAAVTGPAFRDISRDSRNARAEWVSHVEGVDARRTATECRIQLSHPEPAQGPFDGAWALWQAWLMARGKGIAPGKEWILDVSEYDTLPTPLVYILSTIRQELYLAGCHVKVVEQTHACESNQSARPSYSTPLASAMDDREASKTGPDSGQAKL